MTCRDCPVTLSARNRSGRCRQCLARHNNTDPAVLARRAAAIRAKFEEPGRREAYAARITARNRSRSPEELERLREHGRRLGARNLLNATLTPEQRRENGRKRSATVLAHIPAAWRDRYRELTRRGKRAPVALAIVESEIAAAKARVVDADAAATFLARWAPTYRCDARGRPCRTSGYWRYGSAVLTRAELAERAMRKGFAA